MKKIDFAKELNRQQYEVVTSGEGPHLVLAGAGSGKTRTLVYRVAWLINQGMKPEKILLLTFTNKAAQEMMSRVKQLLGLGDSQSLGVWGGTFHSIANRLLRYYGSTVGVQKNFTILDEDDSKSLLKKIIKEFFASLDAKRHPSPAILKETISYSINAQISLEQSLEKKFPEWLPLLEYFAKIAVEYKKRKRANNLADFDDLLVDWLKLTKDPQIRERFQHKWEHILVDEYQDTNSLQAQIIHNLVGPKKNILVVGDDAQSIYSFRAADIQNIFNFPKLFPHCQVHKLEANYRSTPEILDLANVVIADNQQQFKKNLKAILSSYIKPELLALRTSLHEAKWIADRIESLLNEGFSSGQVAVLFRAAHHSQLLEMELNKRGLAYQMRGGLKFFERAHIKDVIAWLKILVNIHEEISWSRILSLYSGIGPSTVSRIFSTIKQVKNISELEKSNLLLTAKANDSWQAIKKILEKLSAESKSNPADIIRLVINHYQEYLQKQFPDYRQRQDDLEQLALFAGNYEKLGDFLAEVSLQENFTLHNKTNQDALILSTIHQAKGLEWRAVFLMNLSNQSLPHPMSVAENNIEEERRLFYVAITRAQQNLYLTYPLSIFNYRGYQSLAPSEFITALDNKLLTLNDLAQATMTGAEEGKEYVQDDTAGDFWDEDKETRAKKFLPEVDEW